MSPFLYWGPKPGEVANKTFKVIKLLINQETKSSETVKGHEVWETDHLTNPWKVNKIKQVGLGLIR